MIFQSGLKFKEVWRTSPVSVILVFANLIVFLLQYILPWFGFDILTWGAINRYYVEEQHEWYRVITAGFLHSGVFHILFNVGFGIYVLSSGLERLIGSVKFASIYFFSMILSGVLVVVMSDYITWTLGASGAIFGALGSLLYITIYRPEMIPPHEAKTIRSLIIFNMIITLILSDSISIPGHLGGLLAGFLLSYLFVPRNIEPYDIIQ